MSDAEEKDLPELRKIYAECSYMEKLTGYKDDVEDPILAEFRGELLPPNGKKEFQRLQTIIESISGDTVGYLVLYHGYPDAKTFWIGLLSIRPTFQRKKFGQEVIGGLIKEIEKLGNYSQIGIGIGVGNDPAMKFWTSCGFTEIIKTKDHGTHTDQWRVKRL